MYHHYPPLPPSSADPDSQHFDDILYTRAPRMPCVSLPPCIDHYHPQPSLPPPPPPRIHPALSATSTVVRYDFARDPQTIRMSSSSEYFFFPSYDPASLPFTSVLHVRCEATGHMIIVQSRNGTVTCLDLMTQLHSFFEWEMGREEWRDVRGAMRSAMKKAYEQRTGYAYSGSARMKKMDYLLGQTTFKRLVPEYGDSTWLLQTC